MTAIIIIGCFIFLILLCLCLPISIKLAFSNNKAVIIARFLFLRFNLSPDIIAKKMEEKNAKPVKPKKEKKKKPPQTDEEEPKKEGKGKKLKEILNIILPVLKSSKKAVNIIRKHFIIYQAAIYIAVAEEDAHKTAITFAKVSAAISSAILIVSQIFVLKPYDLYIAPNFSAFKTRYDISLKVRISPIFLIHGLLIIGWSVVSQISKQKKPKDDLHKRKAKVAN